MDLMTQLQEWAADYKAMKELDAQLKKKKADLSSREETLLERMAEAGMNKVAFDGLGTVYINTQAYPKFLDGKTRKDVIAALKADGYGQYIKNDYNTQQFGSLVREINQSGEDLPTHLAQTVEVSEKFKLTLRKK